MEELELREIEVCLIPPAKPTSPRCLLPLSTFDLSQKRDSMPYMQRALFYDAVDVASEESQAKVIHSLKRSLGEVLVHFYPFAGRLILSETDGKPRIDCNDAGVEFYIATTTSFVTLESPHLFSKLIYRGSHESNCYADAPLLSIQLTISHKGGIVIAYSFDHIVADGTSLWHFITSWAELCRGNPQISVFPDIHSRDFENHHPQLVQHYLPSTTPFSYTFTDLSIGVIDKVFRLSESDIDKLKRIASDGGTKGSFSTYVVLGAYIWRSITIARDLPPTQKTRYHIAMDCRKRLDPPLSPAYFGNTVFPAHAESTAGELGQAGGLTLAANLIHNSIKQCGISYIRNTLKAYHSDSENSNPHSHGLLERVNVWHGSSMRFPIYETDFGWGRPVDSRHLRRYWDGFCFLDPSPNGGRSVEITVDLVPQTMDRLTKEFMHLEAL